jgi:hypothetical protein
VWSQIRSRGICGGPSGTGPSFLQVLRFLLSILVPPTAPHSLIILSSTLYSLSTDSALNNQPKRRLLFFYISSSPPSVTKLCWYVYRGQNWFLHLWLQRLWKFVGRCLHKNRYLHLLVRFSKFHLCLFYCFKYLGEVVCFAGFIKFLFRFYLFRILRMFTLC